MGDPLDQSLSYRDRLPLQVDPLSVLPEKPVLERWHDQNLRTLHAISVLDERHARVEGHGKNLEESIDRLHQKLDVIVDLLGAVLSRQRDPAESAAVRVSSEGVCWSGAAPAAGPDSLVLVSLELHPCAPAAFVWPARVVAAEADECCARFLEMTEGLAAGLDRFVFTRHRRSVAGARSPAGAPYR